MKKSNLLAIQLLVGISIGAVIACAPTKFNPGITKDTLCNDSTTSCVQGNNSIDITHEFEVGTGKVDILFVNDISASMSKVQSNMSARFAGFVENLRRKKIDYRIAVTTTDYKGQSGQNAFVGAMINFNSSNPVGLFNAAIVSQKTVSCENFIVSMFNSYGQSFQSTADYYNNYYTYCPSPSTNTILTSYEVLTKKGTSFLREDANLSIIAISNEDIKTSDSNGTANSFNNMMASQFPNKYWDFHSIIVKDSTCAQNQSLRNVQGVLVTNSSGNSAISGSVGYEYAALSMSAARDIDSNPRPRGQTLNICEADYAQYFNSISTQISDSARMMVLKCNPISAPIVSYANGAAVSHSWNGNKITFPRGTEGQEMIAKYTCAQVL